MGALMRCTMPAMVATLLGFVAARIVFTLWVRPHLLSAKEALVSTMAGKGVDFLPTLVSVAAAPPPIPNAWMVSAAIVDRAHHALSAAQLDDLVVRACPTLAAGLPQSGVPSLRCQVALSHQVQQLVTYQPPSDYWPLQTLETGIFLAAAVALIGATVWRLGRRGAHKRTVAEPRERTTDSLALSVVRDIGTPPVRLSEDGETSIRRHLD
ncbi:MAG TPA: hypothetical protein VEF89_25955 [Solirubrobacteraceae bacterium]|nr:hypothetical protein [Solirubrobacteraceae bacterium]